MTTKRVNFPTIAVNLWDEKGEIKEEILIRPAPFSKIQDVKTLQKKLLEYYEEYNGSLGELLGDSVVYGHMEKIAELVHVVGKDEPGFDLANLYEAGDIIQIGQIFFAENITAEMRSPGYTKIKVGENNVSAYQFPDHRLNPTPSGIARIHDLAFFDLLTQVREVKREEREKAAKEEIKRLEEAEPLKVVAAAPLTSPQS